MSNGTQQSAGCQKGRPIKAGRLYYMKLLLITQSQKQKSSSKQTSKKTGSHPACNKYSFSNPHRLSLAIPRLTLH